MSAGWEGTEIGNSCCLSTLIDGGILLYLSYLLKVVLLTNKLDKTYSYLFFFVVPSFI